MSASALQNLKTLCRGLNCVHVSSPDGLSDRVLEHSLYYGNGGRNIYPKARERGEEPRTTRVQLAGPPAVIVSK